MNTYDIFISILSKIIPLYFSIIIGFIAGRALKTDKDVIAKFLFYMITPIVIISGILKINNDVHLLLLPVLVFCISSFMCFVVYKLSAVFFSDNIRNIIAYSSGSASTGHIGLPVVIILFDPETVGIYILSFMGIIAFESTYGFYIAAKGNFPASYCIKRILMLPTFYAIIAGIALKFLNFNFPSECQGFLDNIRSTYIILGTTVLGLGISVIKKLEFDWRCISITLVIKYIAWPLTMISILYLDSHYIHFYHGKVHDALLILSIVPISATTMIVGSVLNYPAEKLSLVVLLNILAGIVYIPAIIALLSANNIIDLSYMSNTYDVQFFDLDVSI